MVYIARKKNDDNFEIEIDLPNNQKAYIKMPDGSDFEAESGTYYCRLKQRGN